MQRIDHFASWLKSYKLDPSEQIYESGIMKKDSIFEKATEKFASIKNTLNIEEAIRMRISNMKKCLICLLFLFVFAGCGNTDLNMGSVDLQLGNSSDSVSIEDGDPFDYTEYEGTSIPILAEPLPVDELFYLRCWPGMDFPEYSMLPKHLLAKSGCLLSKYGDDGDPERHGTLIDYVDITETDFGFEGQHEGYVLSDGALYLIKTDFYYEDSRSREFYSYIYTSRDKDAGISVEWSYLPEYPDESNSGDYWAGYKYDLKTRELLESNTFITKNMDLFSRKLEVPEFRNDEKKDVQEIRKDLNSMIETGEIIELAAYDFESNEKNEAKLWYIVGDFIADGKREEPIVIYLDPMTAYLREFRYERAEDSSGNWILTNDENRFVFDENWKLLSWSDNQYSVVYSYSEDGIDLNITDKNTGSAESIKY